MSEFVYTGAHVLEVLDGARNYNAWLLATIARRLGARDRVLDFGAGTGYFAKRVAGLGHDVTCVEPDAAGRRALAASGLRAHPAPEAVPDGSIDLAYSLNVLEHIEDDAGALRGLRAKLRPGGGLVLYVPAFMVLYSEFDRLVGHVRRYRRRELAARVEAAGFEVRAAGYAECLGFVAALAYRVIRNDGELGPCSVTLYDRAVFPVSRALDPLFRRAFGKNILLHAERPGA
jgi:SAM-dependent methyltransferase